MFFHHVPDAEYGGCGGFAAGKRLGLEVYLIPLSAETSPQLFGEGLPAGHSEVAALAGDDLVVRSRDAAQRHFAGVDGVLSHKAVVNLDHVAYRMESGHIVRLGHGADDAPGVQALLVAQPQELGG
ncbi:hypothetical protein SDC9_194836 [bioreactor metagenome]|uniref:Uncharacterized protein n=1 Tax=bioreactor metagenome TaxID=1076179 RepID=A0A645I7D1_9ZZZZ